LSDPKSKEKNKRGEVYIVGNALIECEGAC
jgi:hypothetical protein